MIRWTQVTWYSQILAMVLGVVIFALGYWLGTQKSESHETGNPETTANKPIESGEYVYTYKIPTLELPLKYFPLDSIRWGSINNEKDSNDYTTWNFATVDEGYTSFPTTTITLSPDSYSNEKKEIPPIKFDKDILPVIDPKDEFVSVASAIRERYMKQIDEYGDLAKRFLPNDEITGIQEIDIDADGKKEKIISTCGSGGNHCPHQIVILKDDKVIFTTTAGAVGPKLSSTGTQNGFFLLWSPWSSNGDKWDVGLCCMPGYMKTRFVYENGSFVPVYEQEVLYFRVEDTN